MPYVEMGILYASLIFKAHLHVFFFCGMAYDKVTIASTPRVFAYLCTILMDIIARNIAELLFFITLLLLT